MKKIKAFVMVAGLALTAPLVPQSLSAADTPAVLTCTINVTGQCHCVAVLNGSTIIGYTCIPETGQFLCVCLPPD